MIAKYEFIDAEKGVYPIVKACLWLGVSRSGFYEWLSRGQSATRTRRVELREKIAVIFGDSDGTYGYRRVHAQLARQGVRVSVEYVRYLLRELGLYPCQPRPFRPVTTIPGQSVDVPDELNRDFTATTPGVKLVGDITYIPTGEGFTYLATVIDCCTKECVGYAISNHMRTGLVIDALAMAVRNSRVEPDAVFHADRGSQYMSEAFRRYTRRNNIRRSVGRTGVCFDNAAAESFNATVKVERVNRQKYATKQEAIADVRAYIELRYNTRRLHSAIGYQTPAEARNHHEAAQAAA